MKNAELLLIFLVIVILTSFLQGNIFNKNKTKTTKNNLPVPNFIPSKTPSIITSPTSTVYEKNSISTPTKSSTNFGQNIDNYKYPNSLVKEENSSKLSLESNDNQGVITNWYKDKLKKQNMNINSFIITNTNGNVLNKLVSANRETKVTIEISKNNSENIVKISVSISR